MSQTSKSWLEGGLLSKELEDVPIELHTRGQFGQYYDPVGQAPTEADHELAEDVEIEPDSLFLEESSEGGPRKVRRRFYRSLDYWKIELEVILHEVHCKKVPCLQC